MEGMVIRENTSYYFGDLPNLNIWLHVEISVNTGLDHMGLNISKPNSYCSINPISPWVKLLMQKLASQFFSLTYI